MFQSHYFNSKIMTVSPLILDPIRVTFSERLFFGENKPA